MEPIEQVIDELVGTPWSVRRNCWHLVRVVQKRAYGRSLPAIPFTHSYKDEFVNHPEHQNWCPTDTPVDGAIVLMRKFRGDEHAGVYINLEGGLILHNGDNDLGAELNTPMELIHIKKWKLSYYGPSSPSYAR